MAWCRQAYLASSHHLNQNWHSANVTLRNKIMEDLNGMIIIFIKEITFENVVCKIFVIFVPVS